MMELFRQALPPMPPTYPPAKIGRDYKRRKESMFAVIKSGGRQYKVSVGQRLEVNRLPVEDGAQLRIGEVLLISDADTSMIGDPFVANAEVLATVEGAARGEKLIVFKYKSKKRYRHRRGHRQELTVLTINDILANGKSLITGKEPESATTTESTDSAASTAEE
jgi:large subunit ribosomal protein L21